MLFLEPFLLWFLPLALPAVLLTILGWLNLYKDVKTKKLRLVQTDIRLLAESEEEVSLKRKRKLSGTSEYTYEYPSPSKLKPVINQFLNGIRRSNIFHIITQGNEKIASRIKELVKNKEE